MTTPGGPAEKPPLPARVWQGLRRHPWLIALSLVWLVAVLTHPLGGPVWLEGLAIYILIPFTIVGRIWIVTEGRNGKDGPGFLSDFVDDMRRRPRRSESFDRDRDRSA